MVISKGENYDKLSWLVEPIQNNWMILTLVGCTLTDGLIVQPLTGTGLFMFTAGFAGYLASKAAWTDKYQKRYWNARHRSLHIVSLRDHAKIFNEEDDQ